MLGPNIFSAGGDIFNCYGAACLFLSTHNNLNVTGGWVSHHELVFSCHFRFYQFALGVSFLVLFESIDQCNCTVLRNVVVEACNPLYNFHLLVVICENECFILGTIL